MPRPKDKDELLVLSQKNYDRLLDYIDSFSAKKQEQQFPKGTLNRNIRDVLAHLYHWHTLLQGWYKAGVKNEKPDIPAKGYTWKTTPDLNKAIQKMYADTNLSEAKRLFKKSHSNIRKIIEQHSNEELFEKKRYKWTGTTSLAAYIISATSSHYDWAYKLIKKSFR